MENLIARGMQITPSCCLCNGSEETMGHLFLHCSFVGSIWEDVLSPLRSHGLSMSNFITVEALLNAWPRARGTEFGLKVGKLAPYAVIWSVWRARNDSIFRNRTRTAEQVRKEVMAFLWNWMANDDQRGDHHFRELLLDWVSLIQGIG
ncbi:hypothetical protein FRX31_019183 [Thalictrum thalictroides]|uniref:Reverse transcriptase zinc-binding domain-containing protein n=1 Tax=Thalictrum thalictroides TaxID=46969 RepID=A0A7J6W1H1_THATH|nr:hypothetical protein FRX31_019183 [Thalictrum thalictroides]